MVVKDKVAIVTGAARGIGRAIALALAKEGAHVVVNDVNLEPAEETAKEIRETGRKALAVKANVALTDEVEDMVKVVLDEFGRIDILVNNAGITRDTLLVRMKEEDWDLLIDINLKGVFNCTKAVARTMMKQRWGRIINISSVVGLMGNVGQTNYSAAKAGILGLTKTVARELGSRGITVNAVAPGFIDTDMTKDLPEEVKAKMMEQIPLGKLGTPENIADAVVFLASPAAEYITGHTLNVNGGMLM